MRDKKKRLWLAVLAVVLPGPWTPFILLAYILDRAADRDHDATTQQPPWPDDPYAHGPMTSSSYAPASVTAARQANRPPERNTAP